VYAALGHGRSYGMRSRVLVRSLPGILESGLWDELANAPPVSTRALVTDVGNDILYGAPASTILSWVAGCLARLRALGSETVLTDLPLDSIRRMSRSRFLFFRSLLVPSCRLTLSQVIERSEGVAEGLARMAATERLRFATLRPEWYGFDPIHIRPRFWGPAWLEILGWGIPSATPRTPAPRPLPSRVLYFAPPARRWICGLEQRHGQPAVRTSGGTEVWLF